MSDAPFPPQGDPPPAEPPPAEPPPAEPPAAEASLAEPSPGERHGEARDAPRRSWDFAGPAFVAFGTGLIVFICYQFLIALLLMRFPGSMRGVLLVGQAAGMAAPALLAIGLARRTGLLPPRRPRAFLPAGVALGVATWTSGVATLAVVIVSSSLALIAPALLSRLLSFGAELYEPLLAVDSPRDVLAILLVATLVPAICEELLFRGFVQRVLRTGMGPRAAIVSTSVLFALVHLEPLGFLSRLILALGLGVALERTGSLLLPMAMHAFHNFVVLCLFPWDASEVQHVPLPHEAVLGLAAGIPAIAIAGLLWWRALRALPGAPPA